MKNKVEQNIQVLHFKFGKVYACININDVKKVLLLVALNPLPDSPNYFAGVIDYHGQCIPAIDMCLYLGIEHHKRYSLDTPIIICGIKHSAIALIVDKIIDVSVVNENELQMRDRFDQFSPFIAAVRNNNQLSLLVNSDYLFSNIATKNNANIKIDNELINSVSVHP